MPVEPRPGPGCVGLWSPRPAWDKKKKKKKTVLVCYLLAQQGEQLLLIRVEEGRGSGLRVGVHLLDNH